MQKNKIRFTEEAEKILTYEIEQFGVELRELAIEEAKSRGEPVEVIVYDVKKALSKLIKREDAIPYRTEIISRIYMIIGVVIIMGGVFSLFIQNVTSKSQLLTILFGLFGFSMVLASLFIRYLYRFLRPSVDRNARRRKRELQKDGKSKS
jgi:hypothetical protein